MRKEKSYYDGWQAKSNKMPGIFAILNTAAIVVIVLIICYMHRLKYEEKVAYVPVSTVSGGVADNFLSSGDAVSVNHYIQSVSRDWNLILVNTWNNFETEISTIQLKNTQHGMLDERMAGQLSKLISDGKIYKLKVSKAYSEDISDIEHKTGLAVDITCEGSESDSSEFTRSDGYVWLLQNCARYGFILRYTEGKEGITGQPNSATHFRYVGEEHAKAIMSRGITLEEYLEIIGE